MCQLNYFSRYISSPRKTAISQGKIGSLIYGDSAAAISKPQQLAVEVSRLWFPLLIGRNELHGFKTMLPINIGLAANHKKDFQ